LRNLSGITGRGQTLYDLMGNKMGNKKAHQNDALGEPFIIKKI
jgi:hypothetical protein